MNEKETITNQVKDIFTSIRDRYVNSFALVVISYIIYHNWKFFFVLFSDSSIPYDLRLKLADTYWEIHDPFDILILLGVSVLFFIAGLVISTTTKIISDFWYKKVRNALINKVDKSEVATDENLASWKELYSQTQSKLKKEKEESLLFSEVIKLKDEEIATLKNENKLLNGIIKREKESFNNNIALKIISRAYIDEIDLKLLVTSLTRLFERYQNNQFEFAKISAFSKKLVNELAPELFTIHADNIISFSDNAEMTIKAIRAVYEVQKS